MKNVKTIPQEAKLVIFTAPSGAGKTTIGRHLLETDNRLAFSVSATTRAKREKEVDGSDYYFITPEEFKQKIRNDEFLEWEEVYEGICYGTLLSEVERLTKLGKAVLFDVDVKGAARLKRKYPAQTLSVFVKPPNLKILIERLKKRATENEAFLEVRKKRIEFEMTYENAFDKVILNDHLEESFRQAKQLINDFLSHN